MPKAASLPRGPCRELQHGFKLWREPIGANEQREKEVVDRRDGWMSVVALASTLRHRGIATGASAKAASRIVIETSPFFS